MIRPALTGIEVYVYRGAVDMRQSINGLSQRVEADGHSVFSGAVYVFSNRRRDKIKLLTWERTGFVLWYKRLEKDRFVWPQTQDAVMILTGQQLNWLLDGYDVNKLRPHEELRYRHVA